MTEPKYGDWTLDEWKLYKGKIKAHIEKHKAALERVKRAPALQGEKWREGMVRHYDNLLHEKRRELVEVDSIITNLHANQSEGATVR